MLASGLLVELPLLSGAVIGLVIAVRVRHVNVIAARLLVIGSVLLMASAPVTLLQQWAVARRTEMAEETFLQLMYIFSVARPGFVAGGVLSLLAAATGWYLDRLGADAPTAPAYATFFERSCAWALDLAIL